MEPLQYILEYRI